MSNALVPFDQLQGMAKAVAASGLFGMKTPEQALALMLTAQAEGQHPATITQDYDIIQGRAARKTHSVLARFQSAGGKVEWHELTATTACATFSHPAGGSLRMEWTLAMAQKIGLTNKDNWKNYPRAMLRARCIAEGVRAVFPAAIGGMLVAEEAQDAEPRDITAEGQTLDKEPIPMPQSRAAAETSATASKPHTQPGNGNVAKAASEGHIKNIHAKLTALAAALEKDAAHVLDECLVGHQLKTLDGISVETANLIQTWIKKQQA